MLSVWQSTISTAVILLALAPGGLGQYAYFTDDSTPVGVAQNLWHTPEVENARIDLADAGNRVVDAGQRVANQWSLGLESTKQRFKEGFDQISQNSNQNLATAGQGIRQRFDVISNILSNNGNRRQLADILATVLSNPVAAAGLAGAVANAVATAAATAQLNGDINETNQALDDSKDKVAALESTVAALTTRIGTLESGQASSQVCKNVSQIFFEAIVVFITCSFFLFNRSLPILYYSLIWITSAAKVYGIFLGYKNY